MRVKITTEIDLELKLTFEATRKLHGLNYRDIIEKGIKEVIGNIDPAKIIEYEIKQGEFEQEERRQTLSTLKVIPKQKQLENFPDPELEKEREELLLKDYESIIRLGSRVNWDYIISEYKFKDKKEAGKWISSHIEMIKNA